MLHAQSKTVLPLSCACCCAGCLTQRCDVVLESSEQRNSTSTCSRCPPSKRCASKAGTCADTSATYRSYSHRRGGIADCYRHVRWPLTLAPLALLVSCVTTIKHDLLHTAYLIFSSVGALKAGLGRRTASGVLAVIGVLSASAAQALHRLYTGSAQALHRLCTDNTSALSATQTAAAQQRLMQQG